MTAFEPAPTDSVRPRLWRQWVLLLWGPLVWAVHFFVVYLLTEAVCALGNGPTSVGMNGATVAVLVATVAALVASVWGAAASGRVWRRSQDDQSVNGFMGLAGAMLGLVFAASVLFVGVPALVLPPC